MAIKSAQRRKAGTRGDNARIMNVRPDGLDFRDQMYTPTLIEVPPRLELGDYRLAGVPVLDQKQEPACIGYALATVAHYLLRTRRQMADAQPVSPQMFYDMARRYDEWAGEDYAGSSCRGAIKGWFKHGVCSAEQWGASRRSGLTDSLAREAALRPLGAYYRVDHKDLVAMHAALAEVGILFASATIHEAWLARQVGPDGHIEASDTLLGGHAFVIVAYDQEGFWIQNSWGPDWGHEGFGHLRYDDWLNHGSDVWVARLGVPVTLAHRYPPSSVAAGTAGASSAETLRDIRPHVINIGNGGALDPQGDIGTTVDSVREILREDFPRITQDWTTKRIVLIAHGGLVSEASAIETLSGYRQAMLDAHAYPLAFVWKTDYWTTLGNMLADTMRRRRNEGLLDEAKDFMLDRLDDALEPIARLLTGKAEWDEMKENAIMASTRAGGGVRLVADELVALTQAGVEIHLVGHSAGAILLAPLLDYLVSAPAGAKKKHAGLGLSIKSCTLWAPACTVALFKDTYAPAIGDDKIEDFSVFTLTDKAEQDDNCAHIYNKSLLYLVAHAFEENPRIPSIRPDGQPLLGMEKFIEADPQLLALFKPRGRADWIRSPNTSKIGSPDASRALHHGDFDNDQATVRATLSRILGASAGGFINMPKTASQLVSRRLQLERASNSKGRLP